MNYIQQIHKDLENLGIARDDTVFIHSSFKSLGYIEGGAETFFKGLLSAFLKLYAKML